MDFARKILNKYGWKEGEGLGKHSDGIVKPLKASMKFDNAGLGSDQAASDFNNHWWERVFNEAASNVEVKCDKNGVAMDLKNKDDSIEISTKGYSLKKLKKAKQTRSPQNSRYDNFLQSATLTESGDEIENPNKIAITDISVTQYKTLTDEELFRACDGRTGHKGARHGLKLSGKLSRIEQQERELLAKMQAKVRSPSESFAKKSEKVKRKRVLEDGISKRANDTSDKDSNHYISKQSKNTQKTMEDTLKRNKNNRDSEKVLIYTECIKSSKKQKKDNQTDNVVTGVNSFKKSKRKIVTLLDQTDTNVVPEDDSVKKESKREARISELDSNEGYKRNKSR